MQIKIERTMAHSFGVIACLVVLVTLLGGASAQTTHVVLGTTGWVIPPTPNAYTDWAASQTFMMGDTLMFNFVTGSHDVAEVSRASYNACATTGVIGSIINTGPASLTLAAVGEHYYICAFPGHCGAGQKLMINVTGSTASPPMPSSPSPMPSPPMMPTPPMPSTPPPSSMPSAPMPAPPMPSTPSPMPTPPMPSTPSPSLSPTPMSPMPSPPMPSTPSLSPMPSPPMPTPPMPSPPMPTPPMPSPPSPMMPSTPTGTPTSPDPNSASMVVSASLVVIFLSVIVNMMM